MKSEILHSENKKSEVLHQETNSCLCFSHKSPEVLNMKVRLRTFLALTFKILLRSYWTQRSVIFCFCCYLNQCP